VLIGFDPTTYINDLSPELRNSSIIVEQIHMLEGFMISSILNAFLEVYISGECRVALAGLIHAEVPIIEAVKLDFNGAHPE